ncbi:hypothetical protein HY493_04275 [Candidatus Woesearchaeota archaeon]|nr:hypothetical protein [Candidatus Woesearchaeota archaeon]
MGWRDERPDVEDIFWEDKPSEREAKVGRTIVDIVRAHQGRWNWKENDRFVLDFTNAEAMKAAYCELFKLQDPLVFWNLFPHTNKTSLSIEMNDSGLETFLQKNLGPQLERDPEFIEKLYATATEEGKWDKWESEPRIKLKFKDKYSRNKTAQKLRELIGDRPLKVLSDSTLTHGISKKSLAIEPLTQHIGKTVYQYFSYRDRRDFIDDRKDAHRRAAAFELRVSDLFKRHGIEMKPRVKVKGDWWDSLYKIASKEVDMFTTFSATVSDTDMEERFVSLRREGEHRRSVELDAVALVGNTAIVGELKTLPDEKDSVWAWYAHGYASAIHKYVLASGFALRHAFEQMPPFVIPVTIVNRDVKPEELKERRISPALIAALELPGSGGTPREISESGLMGVIDRTISDAWHVARNGQHGSFPASVRRSHALAMAHFARPYASPILTPEELDLLVHAVKQDPPAGAKAYTINGKEVRAHPTMPYVGGLDVRSPWPERQLTLQQFLALLKHLQTQEGRDAAILRAYRSHLVKSDSPADPGQMQLFEQPENLEDLAIEVAKRNPDVRAELVEHFRKQESISMLLTLGAYTSAYALAGERAASAITDEQKRTEREKYALIALPLYNKIVELIGQNGHAELVPKLKQLQEQHAHDPVSLGFELCLALGENRNARHLAWRHDRKDLEQKLGAEDHEPLHRLYKLKDTMPPEEFKEFVEQEYHKHVARGTHRGAAECAHYLEGEEWRKRELDHLFYTQETGQSHWSGDPLAGTKILDALLRLYGQSRSSFFECEQFKKLCSSENIHEIELAAIVCGQTAAGRYEQSKELWKKALAISEERGDHQSLRHAAWIANHHLHDKRKYVALCERAGLDKALAEHWIEQGKPEKAIDYYRWNDKHKLAMLYESMGKLEEALECHQERGDTNDIIRLAYKLGKHDLVAAEIHVLKARLEMQGTSGLIDVAILEEMFGDRQRAVSIYEKVGWHMPLFEIALEHGDRKRAEQEFLPALQEHERSGDFGYCAYLCRRIGDDDRGRVYQALATSFKHLSNVAEIRESFRKGIEEQRAKAAEYRSQGDLAKAKEYDDLVKNNEEKAAHNEQIFAKKYRNRGLDADDREEDD